MRPSSLLVSTLAIFPCLVAAGFGDVTNCALPCVADVSGSNCTASNWICLCANGTWVDQIFNPCVVKSCNKTAQETTFQAFAQICNIFNIPLTASAEATFPASALSANASSSLSVLGPGPVSVTSLPPVTSAASTMETSTTPTSNSASTNAGGIPASSTGTASTTSTPSAGNVGASTSEQNAWFALAVLLLAGAAILFSAQLCQATGLSPFPVRTPIAHLDFNLHHDTTASSAQNIHNLSPRQREKKPARDLGPLDNSPARLRNLPLRELEPAHTLNTDVLEQGLLPQPRSFLATLQQRIIPRDSRPAASRVLNPINYLPRPTPIEVARPAYSTDKTSTLTPGLRETRTLLTLPEQRRSRQNSPGSPVVEHSPVVTDPGSHRSSIGLPANRSSRNLELAKSREMIASENEKPLPDLQAPERAHVPFSKYNTHDRDLEAATNVPTSQGILGQGYGVTKDDQPLHPPRRITSQRSLHHHKSTASLRSAHYSIKYGNSRLPSRDGSFVQQRQESRLDGDDSHEDQGSLSEELAWGPAHPCFPHNNPHVPLTSPEYTDTRIIRIKRDWMVKGDLAPTFSNLYPEILDPLVSEPEFRRIVQHINQTLVDAFDPFAVWNWLDGLLGVVTGWLWEDFRPSGVKGKLRRLEAWIEDWNRSMGMRDGVKIVPLRRTGYMTLDFQIPDPQVRVVGEATSTMAPPSSVGGYR